MLIKDTAFKCLNFYLETCNIHSRKRLKCNIWLALDCTSDYCIRGTTTKDKTLTQSVYMETNRGGVSLCLFLSNKYKPHWAKMVLMCSSRCARISGQSDQELHWVLRKWMSINDSIDSVASDQCDKNDIRIFFAASGSFYTLTSSDIGSEDGNWNLSRCKFNH